MYTVMDPQVVPHHQELKGQGRQGVYGPLTCKGVRAGRAVHTWGRGLSSSLGGECVRMHNSPGCAITGGPLGVHACDG